MLNETLNKLWRCEIMPCEQAKSYNYDIEDFTKLMLSNRKELLATLNKEQQEIFEKYETNLYEQMRISESEVFIYGFKLGHKIAIEASADNSK